MLGDVLVAALPDLRAQAVSRMRDTCVVREASTDIDPESGEAVPGAVVYGPDASPHHGRCRFKQGGTQVSTSEAGAAAYVVQRAEVHFPFDAFVPAVGMTIEGVASQTDSLRVVGRTMRVVERPSGSQTTALRLPVEEVS